MSRQAVLVLGLCLVAATAQADEAATPVPVPVLEAVPGCKHAKLGRVSISIGTKKATRPRGVGYDLAFRKLGVVVAQRGATAVVLRGREAAYVDRVKHSDPRPVYIGLEGLAIRLDAASAGCALSPVDAGKFAERSRGAERIDASTDNKAF